MTLQIYNTQFQSQILNAAFPGKADSLDSVYFSVPHSVAHCSWGRGTQVTFGGKVKQKYCS